MAAVRNADTRGEHAGSMASTLNMYIAIFPGKWKPWTAVSLSYNLLMSLNKEETVIAASGCYFPGNMAVQVYKVPVIEREPRGWCSSVSLAAFQIPISYLFDVSLR